MIEIGPSILVVADDPEESSAIAGLLREAGFRVVARQQDDAAIACERRFAAAVIALPEADGAAFLRRARRRQPGLKALIVSDPAYLRRIDEDCTLVKRPFDARQLLGCVFALVLREDDRSAEPCHGNAAAEFGIAAAKLVCLNNRRVAAAAAGATRLAQELAQQIGETAAMQRRLPVAP